MIIQKSKILITSLIVGFFVVSSGVADLVPGPALSADQLDALHALIKPRAEESRWKMVPWMPATDIWAARQKAAEQDKPILLWYMAGEPLGTC